ncbi:MAG TPA: alpha/beta hydrolase [Polaromonas sp.]|uniref:alpha/beta hydrolase family protein n=1 Tax=Polaromonas sp. TaxID=1869339 RepID=UPI002D6386B1|nr:alpha/beta hydrolase [Polaromonas sp.]HYW56810.1 alpha/beta hydrolase [Polaromonas sp.]
MGEAITSALRFGAGGTPTARRWYGHQLIKKPFFGRFMKPWRWPADVPQEGWERVQIASRSTSQLATIVARTPLRPRGVVVCAHPMGFTCKGFWLRHGHAQALLDAGFHVVAFDFNGFGESPSTNFDFPGDALSVGLWARQTFPGLPVHALTASFGAINTLSAIAETNFPFDKVVAEGCPPTLPDFWKAYPFAHAVLNIGKRVNPQSELKLRPVHHLASMQDVDVLLIHSHGDRLTPVPFGDALQQAAAKPERIQRLVLERADHTHGMRDEPQRYWSAVLEFFNQKSPGRV